MSSPESGPESASEAARPSPLERPAVRRGLAVGGLAIVLALGATWFQWETRGRFIQSTNDAFLQADQVTVSPRVGGYVEAVLVSDNQTVAAGQPLVRIEAREPQAQLDQAQAQVDQGQASIAQAQAQIRQQEAQVAQAQARLEAAHTSAAFAAHQVDRYGPLAKTGAETGEHLDQLRQNSDQAQAQSAEAAAQLLAARRQIDTLHAQIAVATAQIEQASAQVRQARLNVDDTVVRASIAGRIGDRSVRPGQFLQPGTPMMTVVPVQSVYLVANFKETQLARMRIGQPATIKVDALGGQTLHGVVDSFAPGTGAQFALIPANNATGNFTKIVQRVPVRIRIDADPALRARLLPGLSVEASVDTLAKGDRR
ncbi:MAG: HlyD family secretion protein [Caulobacteraceae bacterium]|nr:HlyD family secretion protein [Caulobacteraceae bacterium]